MPCYHMHRQPHLQRVAGQVADAHFVVPVGADQEAVVWGGCQRGDDAAEVAQQVGRLGWSLLRVACTRMRSSKCCMVSQLVGCTLIAAGKMQTRATCLAREKLLNLPHTEQPHPCHPGDPCLHPISSSSWEQL